MNTCEEYVVQRILKLEEENLALQQELHKAHAQFDKQTTEVLRFLALVNPRICNGGSDVYLDFRSIWKKYPEDHYDEALSFLKSWIILPGDDKNDTEQ